MYLIMETGGSHFEVRRIADTKVEAKPCDIMTTNWLRTVPVPNFQSFFRTSGEGHSSVALLPSCLLRDKLAGGQFNRFQRSPWY